MLLIVVGKLLALYLDNLNDEALERVFGVCFGTISTHPVKGGYAFLKSKGVDLITNDRLRRGIHTEIISSRTWNINPLGELIVELETLILQLDVELQN